MPRKCHLRWAGCRRTQIKCKSTRPTEYLARVVIEFGSTNPYGAYRAFFQKKEVGSKAPAQVDQPWSGAECALGLRSDARTPRPVPRSDGAETPSREGFASPQNFSARSVTRVRIASSTHTTPVVVGSCKRPGADPFTAGERIPFPRSFLSFGTWLVVLAFGRAAGRSTQRTVRWLPQWTKRRRRRLVAREVGVIAIFDCLVPAGYR
jgi:hypothetical protein